MATIGVLSLTEYSSLATTVPRMMIFSHISVRDGAALLGCIANIFKSRNIRLQRLIISTYDQRLDGVNDTGELRL